MGSIRLIFDIEVYPNGFRGILTEQSQEDFNQEELEALAAMFLHFATQTVMSLAITDTEIIDVELASAVLTGVMNNMHGNLETEGMVQCTCNMTPEQVAQEGLQVSEAGDVYAFMRYIKGISNPSSN